MKKDLHIVFGEQSKAVLIESNLLEAASVEIVAFNDLLSLGPLCDSEDISRINSRKLWLASILDNYEESNIFSIEADHNSIQNILTNKDAYSKVYIWLGSHTNERIAAARLLFHIKKLSIPIFKLDFSKGKFKNVNGAPIILNSLCVMKVQNLLEIAPYFEEINSQEIQSFASLWSTLRTSNSFVRIFDKNGILIEGDESFFDQYLLNRCTATNQSSAYIAGCAMSDIWEDYDDIPTGDIFIFHRLNHLGKNGKIQISERTKERGNILFQVRKSYT